MNKGELIDQVAAAAGLTKAQAQATVTAITDTISQELAKGNDVALVGFGTFTVKERAAREGRNPQTGKTIKIAAAKVPGFKPGKGLKDAVN
ncbi:MULTISPECIES: HU family DNA-binding protein [Pseudomonas]|jgi:DNA-binding protein HU-beta|uniref:DNA-binding protein HU-beta n=3 Tax=Pseudomonas TaxID=286 RepID=A0A2X2F776_PSELU|nr:MULTISPECIES: HU family DNA-binding protein [Pseudomonas]AYN96282.1 HU family DNA-binding protein [Pseudomonas sp. LTJR-52]ENA28691.1 hypothetical protein HMPREF1487_08680 [Pseudomonas sp. HPB0071]MBA1246586.1 HU family DNA-binding protein [Pseudomonas zeshuii]MBF8643692.1 HU family DNA-binding protein [Pseudomonas zeshuii]MBH3441588.1 HU family DNA-binding protein [Pseudomonas luteola]